MASSPKALTLLERVYAAVSTFTLMPGNTDGMSGVAPDQADLIRSQPGCRYVAFIKISGEHVVLFQVFESHQDLEDAR